MAAIRIEKRPTSANTEEDADGNDKPFKTPRGFNRYSPMDTHYGATVEVYESSGFEPAIWMKINETCANCHLRQEPCGGDCQPPQDATALLTPAQARELIRRLNTLLESLQL
jgi:hypothetical protein